MTDVPGTPQRASRGVSRRIWAVIAAALAVVGAIVLVIAVRSSSGGPPQPGNAAAGTIGGSASGPTTVQPSLQTADDSTTPAPSVPSDPTDRWDVSAQITAAQPLPPPHDAPPPPPPTGPILPAVAPVQLTIPAIGVNSSLLQLGLLPDGTIEVPSLEDPDSKAGWYTGSPSPGTQGPAIVLGHVDSRKYGPGVFYDLGSLVPGDTIEITRQDGSTAIFAVDAVRSYAKDAFPTLEVYQNLDHAGLRLITCGGTFDPAKESYESNIVAFASLVGSR